VYRRTFLKSAGLATAGLVTGRAWADDAQRPNLLIIHTDEHNFRTLGPPGSTPPRPSARRRGVP